MFNPNTIVCEFLRKSTLYEVNLRQYTREGTIRAFLPHMQRLSKMGVGILWLMPIHPIGIVNRKGSLGSYYSSRDFKEVNPEFGNKDDLKELIEQAHALGMKVIIDWVANHAAWDNVWTINHPEYFEKDETGNFRSPYDWSDVIQFDHSNEAAHDALREAMCYWVSEFDIDGFRADLAHLTPLRYWIKARKQTEAIKENLIWLAETEDADYYQAFDMVYSWKWMHKTEHFCRNQHGIHELTDVLGELTSGYPDRALQIYFTSNHDENSWNGTEYEKYSSYAAALSVFSFYYPNSVPLIYSGQEIPNHKRLAFFDKDELIWQNGTSLHNWFEKLAVHRSSLICSEEIEYLHAGHRVLAFKRGKGIGSIIVVLNFQLHEIHQHISMETGDYKELFSEKLHMNVSNLDMQLPPGGYMVLEKNS